MQPLPTNNAMVLQGRVLALVATVVVPFVIAWYGVATGYPPGVVVPALIIWGAGTTLWLRRIWPRLKANHQIDLDPPSNSRR